MPNYRRARDGNTWFFTVVTQGRVPILTQPAVRLTLKEVLTELQRNSPFRVQAWVLLPDHIHCIWHLPENDSRYSMRWGWFKKEVTKRLHRGGSIWQARFWEHQVRNDRDYAAHCDYIHYNPVKHGLVLTPRDWPWSTFHRFMQMGIYAPSWGSEEVLLPDGVGHE
jgi:putative transposase